MSHHATNPTRRLWASALAGVMTLAFIAMPQTSLSQDADSLWTRVEEAAKPRPYPAEWSAQRPSPEQVAAFHKENGELTLQAAQLAREFHTSHPDDERAAEAKSMEADLLKTSAQLGNEKAADLLAQSNAEKLNDPNLPEEERFQIRSQEIQKAAMAKQSEGQGAILLEFEKGIRQLRVEFPNVEETDQMLLFVAQNIGGDKAKALAKELADGARNAQVKEAAKGILAKMSLLGSPLDLQFTAVDGREVDVSKLKGKVVLIDFWATWCGPCVAELPNVKAAYERLHPKGFEIIGISFDQSKDKLTSFVKRESMSWPQYFDGEGWQNKFGQQYGINSIPSMWLVDKDGLLVDMNARANLEKKVEDLLAKPRG